MNIKSAINPKDYNIGGLVVRMQVDDMHTGHKDLIEHVLVNHDNVVLFLGIPEDENTKKNPLDFATRADMIRQDYPDLQVFPIRDQCDNFLWSKILDNEIVKPFGNKSAVLYGSRDSFIPFYKGKYPTIELESTVDISGTEIRERAARKHRKTADFRAGVIFGIHSKKDVVYSDMEIITYNDQKQILMYKKPNEHGWFFFSGFTNKKDESIEKAATRVFSENAGINCSIGTPRYLFSQKMDNWRYRGGTDSILGQTFLAPYKFGFVSTSDTIVAVEWIDIKTFSNFYGIRTQVNQEHREIMTKFINLVYDEGLLGDVGERLPEREENITYLND